ncbi:MAG: twin-arginine translocation signal domain-containing protein [Alphaproteobacteria bacterium]|nr:twin-arginine translocation signal domain-containing protein [Alphaproteobacteria bacterium]
MRTRTRRQFLATLSVAGAAGLLRVPSAMTAEASPETTSVRIAKLGAICLAPQYVSEELLRVEGFIFAMSKCHRPRLGRRSGAARRISAPPSRSIRFRRSMPAHRLSC